MGKEDSNCTVSACSDEVTAAARGWGYVGHCVVGADAVLLLLQNVEGRAGWTQETVGPGSGHYCLLLPTHPPYTALMHIVFARKLATTNPLLTAAAFSPTLC